MLVHILLVVLFSLQLHVNSKKITKSSMSCSGISLGSKYVISDAHLLKKPTQGTNLKICPSNLTCCSEQTESKLFDQTSRHLEDALRLRMITTQDFLRAQTSTFDDFFKNLLKEAQGKWHAMLLRTYKKRYENNRQMFHVFYSSLEQYYTNGSIDLTSATDFFFKELLNKVLVLLDPSLRSEQGFLNCTSANIDIIKPFGNIRTRLTSQLKSSLFVARTLTEALKVAHNFTTFLIEKLPTSHCFEDFRKIQVCPICQGISNATMCKKTCESVLHSCMLSLTAVDKQWNDYLQQLIRLSLVMEGPYNFEAVAGTLSYDLSNAVMELQRNLSFVLKKARAICKMNAGKTKRAVDSSGNDFYLEGSKRRKRSSSSLLTYFLRGNRKASNQSVKSLDSLTSDFRKQISGIRDVWSVLANKICNNQSFVPQDEIASCWNGIGLQSNSPSVPVLKLADNKTVSRGNIAAQFNVTVLKIMQEKIKSAVNGRYLSFLGDRKGDGDGDDDEDTSGSGSGDVEQSGSGSKAPPVVITTVDVLGGSASPTSSEPTTLSSSITSSPTTITITCDDEDSSSSSGSGSGSGCPTNEISEITTTTENPDNTEDNPPTSGMDQGTGSINVVQFLKTNVVLSTTTNGGKTRFLTNGLVTYFCLFLSASVLYFWQ